MLYTEIRHISRPLIAGAFLHAKKARVGSGNSMRYLHCHFYRVDFNQGLSGCATAWPFFISWAVVPVCHSGFRTTAHSISDLIHYPGREE